MDHPQCSDVEVERCSPHHTYTSQKHSRFFPLVLCRYRCRYAVGFYQSLYRSTQFSLDFLSFFCFAETSVVLIWDDTPRLYLFCASLFIFLNPRRLLFCGRQAAN